MDKTRTNNELISDLHNMGIMLRDDEHTIGRLRLFEIAYVASAALNATNEKLERVEKLAKWLTSNVIFEGGMVEHYYSIHQKYVDELRSALSEKKEGKDENDPRRN